LLAPFVSLVSTLMVRPSPSRVVLTTRWFIPMMLGVVVVFAVMVGGLAVRA